MPYLIIIVVVLIISPFILRLAQSQKKEVKKNLLNLLLFILAIQVILGFLNWENLTAKGRSGFELSFTYPDSFLGLLFIIPLLQSILLLLNKSFNTLIVVLNFINSVLIFIAMIRLSNILGFQAVSFASIGAVFLVLFGNVIGLAYINKDKYLLKEYFK